MDDTILQTPPHITDASSTTATDTTPPEYKHKKQWQSFKNQKCSKVSLGVACCRINHGKPEILMICKRYTYSYNMFIHGRYNGNDNSALVTLFNGMTFDEKITILSLNFVHMWYIVWLNSPVNSTFFTAKSKFETNFLTDNGARLRRIIDKSTNSDRIWEIPKGKKRGKDEPDIQCAVREFSEETGIHKSMYKLFPSSKFTYSYVDSGVKYTNIYYVGFVPTTSTTTINVNFKLQSQIDEISDIRWMNIEDVRFVDRSGRVSEFVKPIFNMIKKYSKGM